MRGEGGVWWCEVGNGIDWGRVWQPMARFPHKHAALHAPARNLATWNNTQCFSVHWGREGD